MRVRVLAEAEAELLEAALFYERRQNGLGWDFHACVENAIAAIAADPLRFPVYEGAWLEQQFRRAMIDRFPYVVVYKVVDGGGILVVAVAHTSRQPGYWQDRA